MSSIVSKNNPPPSDLTDENNINEIDPEEREKPNLVTTHLYLKPAHSTETLDKEVVLRRLRQRRRMSKVGTAVKALLTSPFASKPGDKASVRHKKWVDDAFAAP
ncbi:hypothetical protein RHSIM_Rhsim06G0039800 [Rhododendron simsii]|uniref:Uncharacterized protein n=1 Tax=Rhododendron simsii TaxID=118357 RepID=A0A834LMW9_RHOSS|nr:hypothetical protein RHSIM_Rhsim06G0039800 [Rhododendron simsii]